MENTGWSSRRRLRKTVSPTTRRVPVLLHHTTRILDMYARFNERLWAIVACTIVVSACPEETAIWIQPGSTVGHLVFDIGRDRGQREAVGIGVLIVETCSSDDYHGVIMWGMTGIGGTAYTDRAVYGVPSPGFATSYEKHALTPGCYVALISGTGRVRFDVRRNGMIVERDSR